MIRLNRAILALAVVLAFGISAHVAVAGQAPAQGQAPAVSKSKWPTPVRGDIELQMLKPDTKVKGDQVVTTLKVKNVNNGPIAGLLVEEFWYSKSGDMVPGGGKKRIRDLIEPGQIVTITLETVKDKNMFSNKYMFSHANGKVKKVEQVKAF